MRLFKVGLVVLVILVLIGFFFCFVGKAEEDKTAKWGVNFSQKHASLLGLNWKETYLALINDLKVRRIKLITHWDQLEPKRDSYSFEDLDWQIKKAEEKGVEILLVMGMKTPRWPECHIPKWASSFKKKERRKEVLELIEEIVLRFRDRDAIWGWQIENEPFFPFGNCPPIERSFVKKEINLVKSLDFKRPVVITESGEFSPWTLAAQLGDVVGVTMYRKVWFKELGIYISYPFAPIYYWRKAQIIKKVFDKRVIVVELQAEPWGPVLLYDLPLEEQKKTMNLERFKKSVNFAKRTGLNEFYLWGAEWWYWLKKNNKPAIWNEAKELFP